jgi:ubiquinone/menaquinone biosynthesis C-methylase UbiE
MAGQGLILGLDHSETMVVQASFRNRHAVRQGLVHLLRGRVDALPWRDNSIDRIIAVHVVYFAGEAGVREARRVLRPGGRIVIVATDQSVMTRWKFAQASTHELFDLPGLTDLLMRGGFATSKISVTPIKLAFGVLGLLAIATK